MAYWYVKLSEKDFLRRETNKVAGVRGYYFWSLWLKR